MSQPCSYDWCIAKICAGYFLGGVGLEKSSRLVDMSELSPTSCSKRLQEIKKKTKGGGGGDNCLKDEKPKSPLQPRTGI